MAPKARESNPDCVVVHKIRSDDAPPVVSVEFGKCRSHSRYEVSNIHPFVQFCETLQEAPRAEYSPSGLPLCAVNGFRDQFNCHKFTVNDIIQRIRNVSNEMETKGLLADAGLKSGEMDLRGVISGKLQGRQQEKRVSRR